MNTLDICNSIRMEVEHASDSGFPLDVFPATVKKIILDAVHYDSLNLEFVSVAMLSAVATALGNSYRIHIKSNWYTNCALYLILVGRPGSGKTPAHSFAYAPIREYDIDMSLQFRKELEDYHRAISEGGKTVSVEKPHICQTVLGDFTPETMYTRHYYNQRGIVILVDEFLALIKSRKRYNSENKLIEDLLSAFSGSPINYTRKDEESHILIKQPCINIIGGIQTKLLQDLFTPEFTINGFTDRLLFVAPQNLNVPLWSFDDDIKGTNHGEKWAEIINKILAIKCDYKENSPLILPKTLELSDEARKMFFTWNNENATKINSIIDDDDLDTRLMKLNGILPCLALILQVLRWAAGESHLDHVDATSLQGALRLMEYFDKTHDRMKAIALTNDTRDINKEWLDSLPNEFSTDQALAGWLRLGMKRRSLFNHLKVLCSKSSGMITKDSTGHYHKNKPDQK